MGIIRQHNWGAILWVMLGVYCSLGQLSHKKPWPTYSLQNMPQTRFTCHDKILGGYYADPETQCQMFHVCVKVAGVGVQDFRFLCPNSTAFDQEAQICANWGDVDCEQAVLYYGSDNFDLYRIGSGFESKRAPLAEEEEATFHLQRAETGDLRRSKETRVDQKIRPETSSYTNKYQSTTRGPFSNGNGNSESRKSNYDQNNDFNKVTQRFDGPKKSTSSYFTTPRINDFYNNADSKQDADDLFKGSHSSNFFSNRNGGREDDFYDSKQTASTSTTTSRPSNPFYNGNVQQGEYNKIADVTTKRPHRSRRPILNNPNSLVPSTTTTRPSTPSSTYATTVTDIPKTTRRFSAQTSFNYGNDQYYKQSSSSSTSSSSTPTTSTTQRSSSAAQRFSFTAADYQQNIKPTTYSPSSAFRYKTTTSKYDDIDETALRGEKPDQRNFLNSEYENQNFEVFSRVSNRKSDNAERNIYKQQAKDTALANRNEFTDFAKNKEPSGFQVPSRAPQVHSNAPQVPLNFNVQPLDPSKLNSELRNINQTQQPGRGRVPFNRVNDRQQVEPQYFRARPQETPAPFAVPQAQKRNDNNLKGSTQRDSSRTKGDIKNNAEPQSQPQQQQISKALESNFNTYSNTQSRTRQDQRTGVVSNNGYLPLSQNQPVPSPTDSTLSGLNPPQRDFGRTRTKQRLGGNTINPQQQQAPKQFETSFNGSNGSNNLNSAQKEASRTRLEQQSFQQKTPHHSNFIGFNSQQGDIIRSKTKSRTGSTTSTSEPSFSTTTGAYIPESTPIRGRGRINYKATTQHQGRSLDNFVSSTTSGTKKFSTLVPKDQYYPTTFKPSNYKKAFDQKPTKYIEPKSTYVSSTTSSPSTPDEDDGQYHPELYENDYSSNNVVPSKKPSTQTTSYSEPTFFSTSPQHRVTPNFQPTNSPQTHLQSQQQTAFQKQPQHPQNNFQQQSQQKQSIATPTDLSDEEELFKTAHSLNLGAASINKLRADTIKTVDKTQQQSSLNFGFDRSIQTSTTFATAPVTLTSTTTTWRPTITSTTTSRKTILPSEKPKKSSSSKRPPHADADTSYDYAYYDSLSETPQEYPEYDVIAEFTKTKKH